MPLDAFLASKGLPIQPMSEIIQVHFASNSDFGLACMNVIVIVMLDDACGPVGCLLEFATNIHLLSTFLVYAHLLNGGENFK